MGRSRKHRGGAGGARIRAVFACPGRRVYGLVTLAQACAVFFATALTAQTTGAVRSRDGMVVSGSATASAVGADVLAAGGNAVDAAVATAFALAVVEPSMSGIGGRTQMLIRRSDGTYHGIDGTTEVPAAYPRGTLPFDDDEAYGYRTVGIPGTIAALAAAIEEHGTWPLARVMAPAIRLAEEGFALPVDEAERLAGVADRLGESAGARRHFMRADGAPLPGGERFVQADLARVLSAVAERGPDAFYTGEIARRMADDVTAHGGWLRYEDLEGYTAEHGEPVRGSYRGYGLVGTYLPASGMTSIEALHILENFEVAEIAGTAEWAALLAQALELAFEDRALAIASPEVGAADLVSKARAKRLAERVRTPVGAGVGEPAESPFTTHLSVADAEGGMVALTQSVGPTMGAKVVTPGLGFAYAATMGYLGDVGPGDRPMSSQSPLIVERDGDPVLVLGGAGARRILSAIVAVLSRTIDEGLDLPAAMAAPRLHTTGGRIDLEVHEHTAWPDSAVADLRALGFEVRTHSTPTYFARINAIARQSDGTFIGVPDPRWAGAAVAPARAR